MPISLSAIEGAAPDQASLKAAAKLVKPAKWPTLTRQSVGPLIWGEHQGSGANPYRVIVDADDLGYKCTCPSRKFPCKHALALMLLEAEHEAAFGSGEPPDWVMDWVGRRRTSGGTTTEAKSAGKKSLREAKLLSEEKASRVDPEAEAKRLALAAKRAEKSRRAMRDATLELDQWISDQLRGGLADLQTSMQDRCRLIAARLVDGKAPALAGRLDELPSRVLALPPPLRVEALMVELSKLALLTRAFRARPQAGELARALGSAENRADLLEDANALRVASTWELVGEQVRTRRDGLIEQASWLFNLSPESPNFAVLLDFFPASAGRRGGSVPAGQQFEAELVFYPGGPPLRAVIADRGAPLEDRRPWPLASALDPLQAWRRQLEEAPWTLSLPLQLPPGRIAETPQGAQWWTGESPEQALPLADPVSALALGAQLSGAVGIWDGWRLELLAAESSVGRLGFVDG